MIIYKCVDLTAVGMNHDQAYYWFVKDNANNCLVTTY